MWDDAQRKLWLPLVEHLYICQVKKDADPGQHNGVGGVTSCHFRDAFSLLWVWLALGTRRGQEKTLQSNQGDYATRWSGDIARFSRRVIVLGGQVPLAEPWSADFARFSWHESRRTKLEYSIHLMWSRVVRAAAVRSCNFFSKFVEVPSLGKPSENAKHRTLGHLSHPPAFP